MTFEGKKQLNFFPLSPKILIKKQQYGVSLTDKSGDRYPAREKPR